MSLSLGEEFSNACVGFLFEVDLRRSSCGHILAATVDGDIALLETLLTIEAKSILIHVAKDASRSKVLWDLMAAMTEAQVALNQVENNSSREATEKDLDRSIQRVRDASARMQFGLKNLLEAVDKTQLLALADAHRAACTALKECFWKAPFSIDLGDVHVAVSRHLPREIIQQLPESALGLLNHHKIPPAMRMNPEVVPAFRLMMEVAREWTSTRKDPATAFQETISAYEPTSLAPVRLPDISQGSKLAEIIKVYPRIRQESLHISTKGALKLAVFGPVMSGRSSWLNYLIGQDLLPTVFKDDAQAERQSTKWPIVIRHESTAKRPRLSIPFSQFLPYLRVMYSAGLEEYEHIWTDALVKRIWDEASTDPKKGQGRSVVSEDVGEIKTLLISIGRIVRCYAAAKRGRRKEMNATVFRDIQQDPLTDEWPQLTLCMEAFKDEKDIIEMLDLPALRDPDLIEEDVKGQWKSALRWSQANVYVCRRDPAIVTAESFSTELSYLRAHLPNRRMPWALVVTYPTWYRPGDSEDLDDTPLDKQITTYAYHRGVFRVDTPSVMCSVMVHQNFTRFKRDLEGSKEVPSLEKMMENLYTRQILNTIADHEERWAGYQKDRGKLDRFINNKLLSSGAANSALLIREKLLPQARLTRVKDGVQHILATVDFAHQQYNNALVVAYNKHDQLKTRKAEYESYLHQATSLSTSFSIKFLKLQSNSRTSVTAILSDFHMFISKKTMEFMDKRYTAFLVPDRSRSSASAKAKDGVVVSEMLFTECIAFLDSNISSWYQKLEADILEDANRAWSACLDDVLGTITDDWFLGDKHPAAQALRKTLWSKITELKQQNPQDVLAKLISNFDFWKAVQSSSSLSSRGSTTAHTNSTLVSSVDGQTESATDLKILEDWASIDDSILQAKHLAAMGFFVAPASPPPLNEPDHPRARRVDSLLSEMKARVQQALNVWGATAARPSYQTVTGALIVLKKEVMIAVSTVFRDPLTQVNEALSLEESGLELTGVELEQVILAEINTICARSALNEITFFRSYNAEKRIEEAIKEMQKATNGSQEAYEHLVHNGQWHV